MTDLLPTVIEYHLQTHDWRDTFREWLRTFRSPRTVETYIWQWEQFWKAVEVLTPAPTSIQSITGDHIAQYRNLRKEDWQPTSVNLAMSAMSSFFTYCVKKGLLEKNPCREVTQLPVNQYGKANFLTGDEIKKVLALAREKVAKAEGDEQHTRIALRLVALLTVALGTGVRLDALSNLRWGSFKRGRGGWRMYYTVKGGKKTSKPVPEVAHRALTAYLNNEAKHRDVWTSDAPIWVDSFKKDVYASLSTEHIERIVREHITEALGQSAHGITVHSLRHSAAQLLIDNEKPITHINRLLDHQNLATTMIYVHATSQHGDLAVAALDEILGGM